MLGGVVVAVLEQFLAPRAVAVVGAARTPAKVGHIVLRNLVDGGFPGPLYPVNPNADTIAGLTAYPSVSDLPGPCDLAVIVLPAADVVGVVRECGAAGIPAAIVISAGFKESGPAGGALERELVSEARSAGVRILGPNCLGLIATDSRLNASFAGKMPPAGSVAFLSQSGALGTAILDYASGEGIGLSHFASLGNRADVSESELITAFAEDSAVNVVAAYFESIDDGAEFIRVASAVSQRMPMVVLKSGTSDAGARAVSSHTGSLAGADVAYDAAFRQAGVLRARSVEELFDFASGLSRQPIPAGSGVAILTNAGGPAVMATDACDEFGVALASLSAETVDALRAKLPPAAALYNPVDVLGDADPARFAHALDTLACDPGVHSLLVILTPQAMTDAVRTAEEVVRAARECGKTTFACFMGHDSVEAAWNVLREGGIPQYPFPERAIATIAAMDRYVARRGVAPAKPVPRSMDDTTIQAIIEQQAATGRLFITEQHAADLVAAAGVPVPPGVVARDLASAREFAHDIGYPVVMKIASPDILHKSDVGGIRTGIESDEELRLAYDEILARVTAYASDAAVAGVQVQKMVDPGREVIIGVNRDPQFGPLVMFGLGGTYVEVMKDVSFRLAPLDHDEARRMIADTRAYALLRGVRGELAADIDAVADVLVAVAQLAVEHPVITELDINPLIVGPSGAGAIAADVRIGIGGRR